MLPVGYLGLSAWRLFCGRQLLFRCFPHLCRVGQHITPPKLLSSFALLAFILLLQYLLCYGAKEFEGMTIHSSNMGCILLRHQRYGFRFKLDNVDIILNLKILEKWLIIKKVCRLGLGYMYPPTWLYLEPRLQYVAIGSLLDFVY